jgi:hypothetical protein
VDVSHWSNHLNFCVFLYSLHFILFCILYSSHFEILYTFYSHHILAFKERVEGDDLETDFLFIPSVNISTFYESSPPSIRRNIDLEVGLFDSKAYHLRKTESFETQICVEKGPVKDINPLENKC